MKVSQRPKTMYPRDPQSQQWFLSGTSIYHRWSESSKCFQWFLPLRIGVISQQARLTQLVDRNRWRKQSSNNLDHFCQQTIFANNIFANEPFLVGKPSPQNSDVCWASPPGFTQAIPWRAWTGKPREGTTMVGSVPLPGGPSCELMMT